MATKRPGRTAPKSAQPIEQALVCLPRRLPSDMLVNAARIATEVNPVNHPPVNRLAMVHPGFTPTPMSIAVLTTKYWLSDSFAYERVEQDDECKIRSQQ
jgi:hypothetical protein